MMLIRMLIRTAPLRYNVALARASRAIVLEETSVQRFRFSRTYDRLLKFFERMSISRVDRLILIERLVA